MCFHLGSVHPPFVCTAVLLNLKFWNLSWQVHAILEGGMSPILCIGESRTEYESGMAKDVCSTQVRSYYLGENHGCQGVLYRSDLLMRPFLMLQLRGGLKGISPKDMLEKVVIAYEPVWAIGTGLSATPAIAQCIHAYIRSVLQDMYGPEVAAAVRIQYGGSVTPETVDELMACPDIDGASAPSMTLQIDVIVC